jgi:septal ring factor EnvC (AmiA/AmiB activator)
MRLLFFMYLVWFAMFPSPSSLFQNPAPQKEDKTPQKASLESQVKILQIQKTETQLSMRFNNCRQEMSTIPEAFQKLEKEKQDAVDAAIKEAGFKLEDEDLNVDTFEFIKKAPVAVVPKPAEPEKKPNSK